MKRIIERTVGLGVALALVFTAAACADGSHTNVRPAPSTAVAPSIMKFEISKVGGIEPAGSSVTVEPGESVLLAWEVAVIAKDETKGELGGKADEPASGKATAEAPVITLDSAELGIHLENLDAIGSQEIEGITADASFTLTATTSGGTDSRTVGVTVKAPVKPLEVSFTAAPEKITAGEKVELCWEISRSDATFSITDIEGNIIHSSGGAAVEEEEKEGEPAPGGKPEEMKGKSAAEGEGAEETAEEESEEGGETILKGCIDAFPAESTTYYITVSAPDAETVVEEAKVEVEVEVIIQSFAVTPEKISSETEVTLAWEVSPDDAIVLITPMFDGQKFEAKGEAKAVVKEETTFTLKAYRAGSEEFAKTKDVTVRFEAYVGLVVEVSEDQVIFAGEEAEVNWIVKDSKGVEARGVPVRVRGGEAGAAGQTRDSSGSMTVKPTESTEYTIEVVSGGVVVQKKVMVAVRNWKGPGAGNISIDTATQSTRPITAVEVSKIYPDVVYVGFGGGLFSVPGGLGFNLARGIGEGPVWNMIAMPYMAVFPTIAKKGSNNPAFFDDFEYPVNVIIAEAETGRIYIGTTGGVFYSDDDGASWKTLVGILLNDDISLPHPTCFGKETAGWPGQALHGLGQVCDIAIASDGRFIIATDWLVEYLPNGVDTFLKEGAGPSGWTGYTGLPLGRVNNDLELAKFDDGKEVLFVGTSKGILRSMDLGATYEEAAGAGAPTSDIYTVKVDTKNNTLYAGGADGTLYICELANYTCKGWITHALGGGVIYSIELDPVKAGALFAAADGGIFYSADGKSWKNVTSNPIKSGTQARALAVAKSADGKTGSVWLGTSEGVFVTTSPIIKDSKPSTKATSKDTEGTGAIETMTNLM